MECPSLRSDKSPWISMWDLEAAKIGKCFVVLFALLIAARGCTGTGWIVEGRADAKAPPSCHNLCVTVFQEPKVGANLFLSPCFPPNATSKQRWTYDPHAKNLLFRVMGSGANKTFCLSGSGEMGLAECSPSSTKRWFVEGNHIRNGDPSSTKLYMHAPLHPPFSQVKRTRDLHLRVGGGTQGSNFTSEFTLIPYSAFDYVPPLPADNQSDLIRNGGFSDINFPIASDIIKPKFFLSICSWFLQTSNVTVLPAAKASDGQNYSLNLRMGRISQRVLTSPGSSYLLLFQISSAKNSSVPIIKLKVEVNYSSSTQAKIFAVKSSPNSTWNTHFLEFTAQNQSVNVGFQGLSNSLDGPFLDNVQMFLSSNGTSLKREHNRNRNLEIGAIVASALAFFISCLCFLCYVFKGRHKANDAVSGQRQGVEDEVSVVAADGYTVQRYTLEAVKTMTENFSTLIGEGGFGAVYLGTARDGQRVAVKRAKHAEPLDTANFCKEIAMLSKARHRFVIRLLGFCDDQGELILVYEYMPNGSLYRHLHARDGTALPLSWPTRVRMAFQVAYGLEYLHNGADPPVLHRDVKTANVLLSNDHSAKIADFGISKVGRIKGSAVASTITQARGTKGYVDPQYYETGVLSQKSDVYAFGVVLLEMISGRKAYQESETLVAWAERVVGINARNEEGKRSICEMVDARVRTTVSSDEVEGLLNIALMCVERESEKRPAMFDVVRMMKLQFNSHIHTNGDHFGFG